MTPFKNNTKFPALFLVHFLQLTKQPGDMMVTGNIGTGGLTQKSIHWKDNIYSVYVDHGPLCSL